MMRNRRDGGYAAIGSIYNNNIPNTYLVNTNSKGVLVWDARVYGNSSNGYGLVQATDGGIITAGKIYKDSTNGDNAHIAKFQLGSSIWNYDFGGKKTDAAYAIDNISDGGFILCGTKANTTTNTTELYLVKTSTNGTILWEKTLGDTYSGKVIKQTSDGGFIILNDANPGVSLLKIDGLGTKIWTKSFPNMTTTAMSKTLDNAYIVSGTSSVNNPNGTFTLFKIDNTSAILSQKDYTITVMSPTTRVSSVQPCKDGGYILAGTFFNPLTSPNQSTIFLFRIDNKGDKIWEKILDQRASGPIGRAVALQTPDGGFVLVSTAKFIDQSTRLMIVKTDKNGDVL